MGCVVVGPACVSFLLLSSVVSVRAADSCVVINEVLYDPEGADTGYEFVELFNRGSEPVCLEGWSLETGNGGYENRWKLEWSGSHRDTVEPHGFFVIGEERVVPEPDVVSVLDLQNGPDGCRLTDQTNLKDIVGWGDHAYGGYFEGEPALDAPSGSSIGRDPDGSDSGHNGKDFRTFAVPSPADYNHPPKDLVAQALGLSRHTPPASEHIDIVCMIHNAGTEPCGAGAVLVAQARGLLDSAFIPEDLNPAGTFRIVVRLPNPGAGIHEVTGWLSYGGDRWSSNDTVRTSLVIPPPPLVINEIMFRPDGRDCEWIELYNHSDSALNLKGWTLEDSRGRAEPVSGGELVVPGGAFLVLVEDDDIFEAIHPDVPEWAFLRPVGGWPTLNDVDGPLRYADAVAIRDAYGTMMDSVAYGRNWSCPGRSVERIDPRGVSPNPSNWSPHFGESAGSPGAANSVSFHLAAAGKVLSFSPQTFSPNGDGKDDVVAVSVALPGTGLVRLSVFDVNGRAVKRLIDGEVVDSGRVTFWDGTCDDESRARTGVYLLLFEARMRTSNESFTAKSPLVLIRR